jgi:hypothetical protein
MSTRLGGKPTPDLDRRNELVVTSSYLLRQEGGSGTVKWPDRQGEPEQFDQIWFAGNHADIGGSYPENESRLSDITLDWMVEFIAGKIPEGARVVVDKSLLQLYPSADGMMHDECMVGIGGTALHWSKAVRDVPDTAQLHETVYARLAMKSVRNYTSFGPYRPVALQNHLKAKNISETMRTTTSIPSSHRLRAIRFRLDRRSDEASARVATHELFTKAFRADKLSRFGMKVHELGFGE